MKSAVHPDAIRASRLVFWTSLALVGLALTFGGASRDDAISVMVVKLAGLGALIVALLQMGRIGYSRLGVCALALLALVIAIPLVQLVPLPPEVWKGLPGRAPLAQAAAIAGLPDHWRPMSLAPDETARAVLWLIPPLAMFLAVLQCDERQRSWLALAVVAVALASLAIAVMQAAGGSGGVLNFYGWSTLGEPKGFFANRNHQASFMACAAVFAASLPAAPTLPQGLRSPAIALALMFLFAVGAAAPLSRAGLLLLGPGLLAAFVVLWPNIRANRGVMLAGFVSAGLAGAALVVAFKGAAILQRFQHGEIGDVRLSTLPQIVRMGEAFQPWGSGVGSFDLVYRAAQPLASVSPLYLNHVHNDYVEGWLEGGVLAGVLIAGSIVWLAVAGLRAWRRDRDVLGRLGAIAAAVLLLHSAVDYPLRTHAAAVLLALSCALMLAPPRSRSSGARSASGRTARRDRAEARGAIVARKSGHVVGVETDATVL